MKREYMRAIFKILRQIDDSAILSKIYTFAKTHLEILQEKGGAE